MSVLRKSKSDFRKSTKILKKSKRGMQKSIGFSKLKLHRDIMREGRVLNRHAGAMEIVADKVCREMEKWADGRAEITQAELDKATAAKMRKYDADVAYIFRTRGSWI